VIAVTTSATRLCGAPDVTSGKSNLKECKVSSKNNSVLRVVDNNCTNTKSKNKNNIINGTTNQQLANNLQKSNKNCHSNRLVQDASGKLEKQKTHISLASLFDQFTEVVILDNIEDQNENLNSSTISKNAPAIQLNLACDFTSDDKKSKWEAILYQNNLYLQIPAGVLFETSKEAFVNLLEYAEEELKCQNVIICLDKNSVKKSNNLIRMFMYFGFYALTPSHPLAPKNASDSLLFMAYSFE